MEGSLLLENYLLLNISSMAFERLLFHQSSINLHKYMPTKFWSTVAYMD